jgi:hypothetical protein
MTEDARLLQETGSQLAFGLDEDNHVTPSGCRVKFQGVDSAMRHRSCLVAMPGHDALRGTRFVG